MTDGGRAIDGNMFVDPRLIGRKVQAAPTEVATVLYAGSFEFSNDPPIDKPLFETSSGGALKNNWEQAVSLGLRMCSLDKTTDTASNHVYLAVYTRPNPVGGYDLVDTDNWASFMQSFNVDANIASLLDFNIGVFGGVRSFLGTWGGVPTWQMIVPDLDSKDFLAKWQELRSRNMRLLKLQLFPEGDAYHMTGLFEEGSNEDEYLVTADKLEFLNTNGQYQPTMRLVDFHVYDQPPTRWYVGVWRKTDVPHTFLYDLDWGTFQSQISTLKGQNYHLKKAVRYHNPIELPEPNWAQFFASQLVGVAGYAYAVAQNGRLVTDGWSGDARMPADGEVKWSRKTRVNLASVSKTVTAVAVLKLLAATGHSVNEPFYPLISQKFPKVTPGIDKMTIANLLTMTSGLVPDGTLNTDDMWTFLTEYLQKPLKHTQPGTYDYSNTSFTLLQVMICLLLGDGGDGIKPYVDYVTQQVLIPMGIDTVDFSATPDPESTATLGYALNDTGSGFYWGPIQCVGAGGWVSSVVSLLKFATGVRNNTVLPADTTIAMFQNQYGCYIYDGIYGQYFHHNGALHHAADVVKNTPDRGLFTGLVHLADGYDAILLANSQKVLGHTAQGDPILINAVPYIIDAFEQRT